VLVVFFLDRAQGFDLQKQLLRRPRGMEDLQELGVFAQRTKFRPNPIGVTAAKLLGIEGSVIRVRGLDALDGTPVLDVKPYMPAFDRVDEVSMPPWVGRFMEGYF
jgi:tRNA-Thr(GGU) m(6)t(6)A37 methyltransferase TsaA